MQPYKIANISLAFAIIVIALLHTYANISWWWLLLPLIIHSVLLFAGITNIRWNFFLHSYYRANNNKQLALTFDDGPAQHTNEVLDILKNNDVKATFFTIGKHAAKHADIVKRWHEEGHTIGNHSYNHGFNFDWQSSSKMAQEIEDTNLLIKNITGHFPAMFRPPYGITNPNLGHAVRKTNMRSIGWTLRSFDTKAKDPEKLLADIFNKLKGGDIILLHDPIEITAKILTPFIEKAKQMGYTFVPVNELLDIEPYKNF